MAEDAEVGTVSGGDHKDEKIKSSPLTSKNLNGASGYLTPKVRLAFI